MKELKKYVLPIITLFILIKCSPPIVEQSEIEFIDIGGYSNYAQPLYWNDSTSSVSQFHSNGFVSAKQSEAIKNISERKTYYVDGSLASKATVKRVYRIDTTWRINVITLEDEETIDKGIRDVFIGNYEKYKDLKIPNYDWQDTIVSNQIKFWKNGNVKTSYSLNGNNTKARKDFNDNNELIREMIVKQVYRCDTTWIIDPVKLESEIKIRKCFVDSFISLIHIKEPQIMIKGQYENNKKVGSWFFKEKDRIVKIQFDKGKIQKNYTEYYLNSDFKELKVKSKGFIKDLWLTETSNSSGQKHGWSHTTKEKIKDGLWQFYNLNGDIEKQLLYNHNSDSLEVTIN
jgi:hypothetical protein